LPNVSSTLLRMADSDASPLTSLFKTGSPDWPGLNSALLHNAAILDKALNPELFLLTMAPD
jgi:hypothetical protein